ncbi:MAG TPA: hypothetical protein PLH97_15160, partial [Verrucomicrobiota bacterium]|nr:hypothetical protein [Verrucomicrobiota bacterium]
ERIANDRLQWRAFGVPSSNVAIINAARSVSDDQDRCLVEIANYSRSPRDAVLRVFAGSNAVPDRVQETRLAMAPQEVQRVVFNIPGTAPSLEVRLEAASESGLADALAEDNRVQLLSPIRRRVRVQVALTNPDFADLVNRALDATGLRAALSANPDLVIHHSDFAGSNAWSLNVQSPAEATAYVGPFVIDTSHPLAQGLALNGAVWAGGASLTNDAEFMPVVLAGNVPLLSVREDMLGRQFVRLNLDPQLSTWTRTPDWPVFWYNLLDWRASQLPGLRESNARPGSEIVLQSTGEPVTVRWPDGTVKLLQGANAPLAIEAPLPGVYTVTMGSMTNRFAVNALAPGESNLQHASGGQWGDWKAGAEGQYEQSPLAWLFGLAALGILTAHLCLVARGRAGG